MEEKSFESMTEDEINLLIEERFFGKKILTQEEMRIEAQRVWKTQPMCRVFNLGFSFYSPSDTFRQHARPFMTHIDYAWILVEKLSDGYHPAFYRWFDGNGWAISQMTAKDVSRGICLFALKEIEREE